MKSLRGSLALLAKELVALLSAALKAAKNQRKERGAGGARGKFFDRKSNPATCKIRTPIFITVYFTPARRICSLKRKGSSRRRRHDAPRALRQVARIRGLKRDFYG